MSGVIERVARVLAGDDLFSTDAMTAHQAASPNTVHYARKLALARARQAIAAMRLPTPEQMSAGHNAYLVRSHGQVGISMGGASEVYIAMIDAALAEPDA